MPDDRLADNFLLSFYNRMGTLHATASIQDIDTSIVNYPSQHTLRKKTPMSIVMEGKAIGSEDGKSF